MVSSTQQAIEIAGVKDGVAIMRDGSYRMVLQVSATNFSLKSEQEQNSIIFQYQSFLNSLHFPIEIVIRSKRLDLTPYLAKIKKKGLEQPNELIKLQTEDYVDFVSKLINLANIMKKTFYVTVAFVPISVQQINIFDRLFSKNSQTFDHVKISNEEFKSHTDKLRENANIVASGLGSMGLHCFQLSTEEMIELFYGIYNPNEAAKERLTDVSMLNSPVIVSQAEAVAKTEDDGDFSQQRIDNSSIVEAQHKKDASEREKEKLKEGEKTVRAPETAKPGETKPVAAPTDGPAPSATPAGAPAMPIVPPITETEPPAQPSEPVAPIGTTNSAAPAEPVAGQPPVPPVPPATPDQNQQV